MSRIEKENIRKIKNKWNNFLFLENFIKKYKLKETCQNSGPERTSGPEQINSIYDCWKILFPSLYARIESEMEVLLSHDLNEMKNFKNLKRPFCRQIMYNFDSVVDLCLSHRWTNDIYEYIFSVERIQEYKNYKNGIYTRLNESILETSQDLYTRLNESILETSQDLYTRLNESILETSQDSGPLNFLPCSCRNHGNNMYQRVSCTRNKYFTKVLVGFSNFKLGNDIAFFIASNYL